MHLEWIWKSKLLIPQNTQNTTKREAISNTAHSDKNSLPNASRDILQNQTPIPHYNADTDHCQGPKKMPYPKPCQAPRILLASCMSFCIIVTLFACMAHRFVSSKRCTMKASQLSCSACMACDCHRNDSPPAGTSERAISRTWIDKVSVTEQRSP